MAATVSGNEGNRNLNSNTSYIAHFPVAIIQDLYEKHINDLKYASQDHTHTQKVHTQTVHTQTLQQDHTSTVPDPLIKAENVQLKEKVK